MNENQVVKEYNQMRDRALSSHEMNGREYLQSLSDRELLIFITGKTMLHGRDFTGSLKNAKSHMKNRDRAIKLFSKKVKDTI